jgi:pilus assembly protein CpaB
MNNKALTLSLLMAAVAVFFIYSYVSNIEEEQKKRFGTEVVVIKAKKNIKEMDTMDETMIIADLVPKKFLEPAAISYETQDTADKAIVRSMKSLAGSVAIVPIRKGEQITYSKITEPSVRTGVSPQIAIGKRAVSIPVNNITGVSKLIKPGDRVDVISIIDVGGGKDAKLTKTVLQDVVVLAVGLSVTNNVARAIEPDPFGGKDKIRNLASDTSFATITLEVDPQQVQLITTVLNNGENSLTLSLRNNDDSELVPLMSTTIYDVLGPDAAKIQRNLAGARR